MFLQLRHWLSMEGRCTGSFGHGTLIAHLGIFKEAQENEAPHCRWCKKYITQEILNSNPHLLALFCRTGRFFSHSKGCEITVYKSRGCGDSGLATLTPGNMGAVGLGSDIHTLPCDPAGLPISGHGLAALLAGMGSTEGESRA